MLPTTRQGYYQLSRQFIMATTAEMFPKEKLEENVCLDKNGLFGYPIIIAKISLEKG